MEPIIRRLLIFCVFALSITIVNLINQNWGGPLVLLWLLGWVLSKIIRVHLPPKANNLPQAKQELPDAPQTVWNQENVGIASNQIVNKKPSFFRSPTIRPYLPALSFLAFLLTFAIGETIWPRNGGVVLASLLMFILMIVFLYPLYKKMKKIRETHPDFTTRLKTLVYTETQATGQSVTAIDPKKIQRAKRNAFWLNVFLFMMSPILFALAFEILPDAMRGVQRSGADSAATAYAILLILTVFGGAAIILLYFFTGIVVQLIRFFAKNKKEVPLHPMTKDTEKPLSKSDPP